MNKYLLAIILILIILFILKNIKEHFNPTFNNHSLKVWKASSPSQLKKGLMFRKHPLPKNYGMLFYYNKYANHSFWMKNTFIPLDMIFLNKHNYVLDFIQNAKPHTLISRNIGKHSFNAIETNAGWIKNNNVNIGDKIKYTIISDNI